MPLYPYRCTKCGHRFEKIQSFNSEPETRCPQCGGLLERVLTAPGLNFKGAGWYVNDYASKSSSSPESSSSASESKAASESKTPSETKTASESKKPAAEKSSAPAAAAVKTGDSKS